MRPGAQPRRIGGYTILETLGHGAFSHVYRVAREGGTGFRKELALKVLTPGGDSTPDLRHMLMEEGKLAGQLHHRNVVSVHEVGATGDSVFLVMDLVEGLDLRTLLRRLRFRGAWLPLPSAIDVIVQALAGLEHAHGRSDAQGRSLGIVHRDLKPDNLLVSSDGCVKVSDFGLARRSDAAVESGFTRGTARFMSPEQARGRPLDARSDVFSAGVLLYMLLSARLPFTGADDREVMLAVARAQFRPVQLGRPHIPDELAAVVHRMMAASPANRYASATAAATALSASSGAGWGTQPERVLGDLVRRAMSAEGEEQTLEEGSTRGIPARIEDALSRRST